MLRPARPQDRDDVLRWRNHPDVRGVSLQQHVITEDEHARWWVAALDDSTRSLLIYERGGHPSGLVTFFDHDRESATAWWGYYLDVDGLTQRGETLPAWIEIQRQGIRHAVTTLGLRRLDAEVLASNEAVRQFNRRLGFVELETYQRDIGGASADVVHVRLVADDRAGVDHRTPSPATAGVLSDQSAEEPRTQ